MQLTEEGRRAVDDLAQRHGVSQDAVMTLLQALIAGQGTQAQFSHPDLGGMGQWSQGGMIMVGDMFNNALKYRVDSLCTEISGLLQNTQFTAPPPMQSQSQSQSGGAGYGHGVSLFVPGSVASGSWWPQELGNPASTGAQNNLHYAFFPATRRLAIDIGGTVTVYDTGDHQITGFSQQQSGDQSLTFTSQFGLVRVSDLPVIVPAGAGQPAPEPAPMADPAPAPEPEPAVVVEPAPLPEPEPASVFEAAAVQPAEEPVASEAVTPPPPPPPMAETVQPASASASPADVSGDIIAMIERLADLRTKGILTDQEFNAKKTELLSRL